jgi:hypothetical protein
MDKIVPIPITTAINFLDIKANLVTSKDELLSLSALLSLNELGKDLQQYR